MRKFPCPREPFPVSSKMDPLLVKAGPISNSGSASGITHFKRENNCYATAAERENV